jgi:VIT1/CCC1 family predicted Fe2+/Mn2+ transporter
MTLVSTASSLDQEHTTEAVIRRLEAATEHSYLGDFVLGAIDGAVTTFAVVAGSAGAGLAPIVAVVLGISNILADGFSMAVSNYLSRKSEHELLDRARRREELHIDRHPEGEREEIRQIFRAKGFNGGLLESIIRTITSDKRRWVDTMLTEELGLRLEPAAPVRAAIATFVAFIAAGMVPLVPLFFSGRLAPNETFGISAIATALTFTIIGAVKGKVSDQPILRSVLETVSIGSCAAGLAYVAGIALRGLLEGAISPILAP